MEGGGVVESILGLNSFSLISRKVKITSLFLNVYNGVNNGALELLKGNHLLLCLVFLGGQ